MSSCLAPRGNSRICAECARSGYEIEIIILSTYNQRDRHILNLDGSEHRHYYCPSVREWNDLI